MFCNIFGLIMLIGYLGSSYLAYPAREREIIVMFQKGTLRLPQGKASAEISEIEMPSGLRDILTSANAESIRFCFPDSDPTDTIMILETGTVIKKLDLTRIFRIKFPTGSNLDEITTTLSTLGEVIFAERIPKRQMHFIPNDPNFNKQWGLHNTGQSGGTPDVDIDAPEGWDIHRGSSSTNLGILDTGVKLNHEDLLGKTSGDSWWHPHGTHVAGIAAAITNNTLGVAGTDWYALIYSRDLGNFTPEDVYDGIMQHFYARRRNDSPLLSVISGGG